MACCRDEILLPDAARPLGEREGVNAPAHAVSVVAVRAPAHEDLVHGGARDDAELADFGDGLGEPPIWRLPTPIPPWMIRGN
jgi:hypothetical protein